MNAYIERRTTIASKIEEMTELEFPTLTICMDPGSKASVLKKQGFTTPSDVFMKDVPNSTFIESFKRQSFLLNKDFWIKARILQEYEYFGDVEEITFHTGSNKIMDFDMDVEAIRTLFHGTCYKIQPEFEITSVPFIFNLEVTLTHSLMDLDVPKGIKVYLTSNTTWTGVISDYWVRFTPTVISLPFGSDPHDIIINPTQHIFKDGIQEDARKCITRHADVFGKACDMNCTYLSVLEDHPPCNLTQNFLCILAYAKQNPEVYDSCFVVKNAFTFEPEIEKYQIVSLQDDLNNSKSVNFEVHLRTMRRVTKEEVEVLTTPDLIGLVGGSLGMFFGFAIAPYLQSIVDRVVNYIL